MSNDSRPGVSAPHHIVVFNNIGGSLLFIDTEDDRDDRLSFSHIDTSDAFVLPQGTAASIGTRERFEAVTAANRARSRDDN